MSTPTKRGSPASKRGTGQAFNTSSPKSAANMDSEFWMKMFNVFSQYPTIINEFRNLVGESRMSAAGSSGSAAGNTGGGDNPNVPNETKRLGDIIKDLDLTTVWNKPKYEIAFGRLYAIIAQLQSANLDEISSNIVQYILHKNNVYLGLDREREANEQNVNEDFWKTYKYRSEYLRDFAGFRYQLEIAESVLIINRQDKINLILLYVMMTSKDVLLARSESDDGKNFVNPLSGDILKSAELLVKPLIIKIDSRNFISNRLKLNAKYFERSLNQSHRISKQINANVRNDMLAYTVRNSEPYVPTCSTSTTTTLPADPSGGYVTGEPGVKDLELRIMLHNTMLVSLMCEEFKTYMVPDTNEIRKMSSVKGSGRKTATGSNGGNKRNATGRSKCDFDNSDSTCTSNVKISKAGIGDVVFYTFVPVR